MEKKMISLEMPAELRDALRKEAFERDVSVSAVIRQLLTERLEELKEEKDD